LLVFGAERSVGAERANAFGGNEPKDQSREILALSGIGGAALVLGTGRRHCAKRNGSSVRSLDTRLTREYGVRFPFVGAGIREVKAQTDRLFGVDFIFDDSAFRPIVTDEHIDVCLVERVQLAVFH